MARVLIIDDSPDMLAMLRTFFKRRTSHEVMLATNGKNGLAIATENAPNLALVDVMMPGMDGYEVVRRLRADPKTRTMGIIILTARGQSVDQQAALQAGADMHLPKPVDMEVLADAVETVLLKARPAGKGIILPVIGLRGGTGVTTVAVNLAALLQQVGPTVLWDLSPASGHAALFLGLQPKTHWGIYLRDPAQPVEPLIMHHRSGLRVLCAPPIPGLFGWFSDGRAAALLKSLSADAQFVVIDMPSTFDAAVGPILSAAEKVLVITGADPPAIQTTLATLQILKRWNVEVVLARNAARSGRHLETRALEQAMRVTIHVDLPYDPNQSLALGKGVLLALAKPDSPLIAALKPTAQQLLGS
ncbi:MAG: response regulator [Anaerolineae bacterium]|nr:response regulator [Anaerolineae bacterium]